MYKLLLATDQPEVLQAFGEITDWDRLGFRQPRIAATAAEAVDSLTHHHADAVAIAMQAGEEAQLTAAMRCPHWHLRPIMRAASDPVTVRKDLVETELLLSRTHADYSNDPYNEENMMQLERHAFFRRLLAGEERSEDRMRRYLRLLRSAMDPDQPCVLMQLHLPDTDGYLAAHWQYGPDRLEVAMRNIFGAELNGMRILISVLPDERIYLLAGVLLDHDAPDEDSMEEMVRAHAEDSITHVKEFLNIDVDIAQTQRLPTLTALTRL